MRKTRTALGSVLLLVASLMLVSERTALAYLDAAAGGLILQFVIGGAVAALVTLRLFWGRVANSIGSAVRFVRGRVAPDGTAGSDREN